MSMAKRVFYIVDVFAESKYTGNQLAVCRDGKDYSDSEMQQIAKEMHYSETTFIISDEMHDEGFDVRIFTPAEEIPFAGHPTLGTAFVIMKEIIGSPVGRIVLNLKVGEIPVTFKYQDGEPDVLWMRQRSPQFGLTIPRKKMAEILGLGEDDIDDRFPVQEVSTGIAFFIVPLTSLEAVKAAKVQHEEYFSLIKNSEAKAILVFCPQTYRDENDLNVRVFVDYYGIPEDPATGSANGCLAGYLVKQNYFGAGSIDLRVEQGYEIGRPSLLFLKAAEGEHDIEVNVGGKVFMVAKGELS
jgi:trans-2,3-dihydro-3-hydroxyanthranilate isomerase